MKYLTTTKGGAVTHQVNDDLAAKLLGAKEPGHRPATQDEIAAAEKRHGLTPPTRRPGEEDAPYFTRCTIGQLHTLAGKAKVELPADATRDDIIGALLAAAAAK